MSVLKLSNKDIIRKEDDDDKIKLSRSQITYDSAMVSSWETRNSGAITTLNQYRDRINNGGFMTADDLTSYRNAVDDYINSYTDLRRISSVFGADSGDDEEEWKTTVSSLESGYKSAYDYFSNFETEEDFNTYLAAQKQKEEMRGFDLVAGQKEIEEMEAALKKAESIQMNIGMSGNDDYLLSQIQETLGDYGSVSELQAKISEKRAYLDRAKRLQDSDRLSSVADQTSENYDPEFSLYSQKGAGLENPSLDEAGGWFAIGSWAPFGKDPQNKVTYTRDNWDEFVSTTDRADPASFKLNELYTFMEEDEVALYNYYLAKDMEEGTNNADKYLASIEETLATRKATGMFKPIEDVPALELLFGVTAGLDQFTTGIKNLFNTEDAYITPSAIQIASGMVREDLKDVDLKWYNFSEGQWDDAKIFGSSLGQVGYDAVTTTANMAPSILASTAIGLINPVAGAVTGNTLLGASAAGNAYQEKLNLGYSSDEARSYGIMVGTSEAVLQYALGGIGKLGKSALTSSAIKALDAADNVFARFAKSAGGKYLLNASSEALEEGLQSVIEPYLWQAVSGEEASVDWQESLYNALMGFVTSGFMEGGEAAIGSIAKNAQYIKAGKTILGADGGLDALKSLANEVSGVSSADMQQNISKQTGKVDSKATSRRVGKLFDTVQTANNLANASQNQADISKSLQRKGFNAETANDIAEALVASYNGQEINEAQSKLLNSVKKNKVVQEAVSNIIANEKSTMGQRSRNVRDFAQDIATGTLVKQFTEKAFTPDGNYKVSSKGNATMLDTEVTAEGKTITKDTGEVIDIKGVASIRNGEMLLDIGDGKTINAKNVAYANKNDALIYEAVANLGDNIDAETANKLIGKYEGGDAMVFARAITQAYTYGFYGIDRSELMGKHSLATELTEAQRNFAYGLGEQYRPVKDQADKAKARTTKAPAEKGVYYRDKDGNATDISTYLKDSGTTLKDVQKTAIEVMRKMSEMMGVRFNVFESWVENGKRYYLDENGVKTEGNPNGFYDTRTGEIYIDLNAGNDYQGTMLFTVAHELTHFMRQRSPEHFTKIAHIVFKHGGMKGSVSELAALKQAKAKAKGKPISYDTALEEVVADGMETILKDGKVLEFMADVKKTDHDAWSKLKEWFKKLGEFLKELVNAYRGHSAQTVEGAKVADFAEDLLNQIKQIWAEGAVAAGESYQAAEVQENTTEDGGVKYEIREIGNTGKFYVQADRQVLSGDDASLWGKQIENYINEQIRKEQDIAIPTSDGHVLLLTSRSAYKLKDNHVASIQKKVEAVLPDDAYALKGRAATHIDELIQVARFNGYEADLDHKHENDIGEDGFNYFDAYFRDFDGSYYLVPFSAALNEQEETAYSIGKIRKRSFPAGTGSSSKKEALKNGRKASGGIIYTSKAKSQEVKTAVQLAYEKALKKKGDVAKVESAEAMDIEVDAKTESVAPTVLKSERTWTESDYVQERDLAAQEIAKAIGVSVKKAKVYIDSVNSIAKMIAEDRVRLDYFSSPGRSSFVSNVEYGGSFDFSTLCKKRRLLTGTFTAIQKALPNTALTADEILDIRNRMKDKGLEVSCGLCYVEGSRANMGQFAKEFLKLYKQYYPDAWQPNMADVNTPDGIEWVRINHPECYEQYEYFWNHYGTLKPGDKNLFASQQKPKLYQLHTEYKGEILEKFNDDDNVEEKNLNGGIRLQSFSDFEIVHLIDTMQIIMDMSRVGLAGQAYTKVPDFAWALGDTGLKINLSLIAKGVDENGKLIFDDVEGMPIDTAVALRNRYSKNVGTILVAFNDEQLLAAMADERVDFIIPFHRSQWKKSQYEAMGLPAKTKDYTYMQNEKYIKAQYHEYRGRMVKDKATNYMPNEYWDFSKSGKENAQSYLEMCSRNNKRPKFYKLLQNNGDGSYSLKADGSTDGYWKLLIDFKMYDNDGNGSPQMPVKPDFNMDEATRMLKEYIGGHSNFPVAQGVVDRFVQEYKDSHKGVVFSDRDSTKYDDRGYGGIREALAKKGLDELSKKLGSNFPLSASFDATMRADETPLVMETVLAKSVQGKGSSFVVGRKAFTSTYGVKTSVHIKQMGIDADLYADVANESISKAIGQPNEQSTLDVIPHIREILENSILMDVERIIHTDKKGTVLYGYRLYNLYWYNDGKVKTPHALACTVLQDLNKAEGYVFQNIENVTIDRGLPGTKAGMSSSVNDDDYTVAQLYRSVKKIDREAGGLKYTAKEQGKYLFSYTERNDGTKYSDRDTDSVSNRSLLANAFEGITKPEEKQKVQEYKDKISLINSEERKLHELNEKIKELSFAKGPKDIKAIRDLQFEARQTANRISNYDKILLRLEASQPLQDVLTREKKMAYKRAEQKGKEALEAYREKTMKTQRELLEKWQESRKKGIDSRNRTAMRHKIKDIVNELNQYLLRGTKDRHVPIEMQKAVAEALDAVNMDTVGAEERIAKLKDELLKAKTPEQIQEISRKIDHIQQMGDKMNGRLQKLKDAYDQFVNSDDPLIANSHDEVISNKLQSVIDSIGNTPLRDMTLAQLEDVYDMYRMVLTTIRNANKAFKAKKSESISAIANRVMEEVEKVGGKKKLTMKGMDGVKSFVWNNLKPVYAFAHIGSDSFTEVFNAVRAGEDVWAVDVTEARAFYLDKSKKHGYNSWDFKKRYNFKSTSGMAFSLDLEQIMSLYAYSKRDQAADHLKKGGIVIDETTEITIKNKLGIPVKFNPTEATAYNISEPTLAEIISKLTDEQKNFVDEMQDYLSTVMGAKGNEVSLEMYGIKLFKEKFYFPLKSAQQFMAKAKEQQKGEAKIKNSGFSKETVQKASNPIVLTPFMNVWADHVNEMRMYHAFVLPMEDFYRVYNYKTPTSETMATESVEMFIQNAYGKGATGYIDQLLKDLNGGARTDHTTGFINKMMGLFKKGAVFASLSVVVQQPSAIARAAALVDTKYFIGPKVDHKRHKALWDEVKQYAPVAIIKEMGYFDTNMGKSTQDFILAKEYSGFTEKMKALVTDSGYRDEALSKAPALADEIAWCAIWEAVKRETKDKYPGLDVKGEPFLKLAGSRFTEIIVKTQVYDSVLSRSGLMRSKDTGMKMATAFMAEPTTSINMIADALLQGKRGNRKYARAAIGAVIASQIINSILVSFVYAARDDDEDETYVEKYIGTLTGEILDSLNPAGYIPFIKDIMSIVQGYDVERSDMAVVSDLWKAWENLSKDNVSVYRKVEGFAGSIAQIFGLPVKNIMRDARGIFQTIDSFVNGQQTTAAGIGYAVKSSAPKWIGGGDVSNQNQLYEAYLSGDKTQIARVEGRYKDRTSITTAIRKALRENDPRIREAAQAMINGNPPERARIAREIIAEGHFDTADIQAAINAEIDKLRKESKGK